MNRCRSLLSFICLFLILACQANAPMSRSSNVERTDASASARVQIPATPKHDPKSATSAPQSTPETPQSTPPLPPQEAPSHSGQIVGSFTSGLNIAWITFASDVGAGHPDLEALRAQFALLVGAGGTVARLWLHTDGTVTPEFTGKLVTAPGTYAISDLTKILDLAQSAGVQLMPTLWSFDMVRSELKKASPDVVLRNRLLLTDSDATTAYLDKALTPMVSAVKNHPALYAWDILNESEGMTATENWSQVAPADRVTHLQIQTFINRVAGRIHKIAPKSLVTSSAVSFKYLSQRAGLDNFYTDAGLISAGGDPLGTLDFYEVHHYDQMGKDYSPFLHDISYFAVDKPVLVGEFAMQEYLEHGVTAPRLLYAKLQANGYMGALGWKDGRMPALKLMLNSIIYLQFPTDLGGDPLLCVHFAGGFGAPFYDGQTLYRMQTATSDSSDKRQRCIVE